MLNLSLQSFNHFIVFQALEIKIENGVAAGRIGEQAWYTLEEDIMQAFAPGQEPMGYLMAADQIAWQSQLCTGILRPSGVGPHR